MFDVFHTSFGLDIDKTAIIKIKRGPILETIKYVGLNMAYKVYAFVRDRASNNDTMADHYL